MLGGAVVAGAALYRAFKRREPEVATDRAAELRRTLDRSRTGGGEQELLEPAEMPPDRVEPEVAERRREVHEEARAAIDEMRGKTSE